MKKTNSSNSYLTKEEAISKKVRKHYSESFDKRSSTTHHHNQDLKHLITIDCDEKIHVNVDSIDTFEKLEIKESIGLLPSMYSSTKVIEDI